MFNVHTTYFNEDYINKYGLENVKLIIGMHPDQVRKK
jgi:hypothetical protein